MADSSRVVQIWSMSTILTAGQGNCRQPQISDDAFVKLSRRMLTST